MHKLILCILISISFFADHKICWGAIAVEPSETNILYNGIFYLKHRDDQEYAPYEVDFKRLVKIIKDAKRRNAIEATFTRLEDDLRLGLGGRSEPYVDALANLIQESENYNEDYLNS